MSRVNVLSAGAPIALHYANIARGFRATKSPAEQSVGRFRRAVHRCCQRHFLIMASSCTARSKRRLMTSAPYFSATRMVEGRTSMENGNG